MFTTRQQTTTEYVESTQDASSQASTTEVGLILQIANFILTFSCFYLLLNQNQAEHPYLTDLRLSTETTRQLSFISNDKHSYQYQNFNPIHSKSTTSLVSALLVSHLLLEHLIYDFCLPAIVAYFQSIHPLD